MTINGSTHTEFHLLVVGGGAAGLTAAETARLLGWKVALVEAQHLGGDCTWFGCVPSKTLLAVAKLAHQARQSHRLGIYTGGVEVNFAQVMAHVRQTIQQVYTEENPDIWRARGVAVYKARAQFVDAHTVQLSTGETLTARRIILATGATSILPDWTGDAPYLTHHTLYDLTVLPDHLLIVGGGTISIEMAQAFVRLGSRVTILTRDARLLSDADADAVALITSHLTREGVSIRTDCTVTHASTVEGGVMLTLNDETTVSGSHLLVALGKTPDACSLSPEKAGLALVGKALLLKETLQTTQKHIYAVGDLAGAPFYTHSAGSEATLAITNMLSPLKSKHHKIAPWCLFTDPEMAQAGLTEAQARAAGHAVYVTRLPFAANDRAMTDGAPEGFIKIVHTRYGRVLGATIVGHGAGEMMNEWAQLIAQNGRIWLPLLATHIYPTLGYGNALPGIEYLRHLTDHDSLGKRLQRIIRWLS